MKKVVSFIALLTLALLLSSSSVSAATSTSEQIPNCCRISQDITIGSDTCYAGDYVGTPGETCNLIEAGSSGTPCAKKNWGLFCLLNSIKVITDWVFTGLLAMVVIFILYGAFKLLKSGGDSKKIDEGRKMVIYAAVGMIMALLAKAIPSLVRTLLS